MSAQECNNDLTTDAFPSPPREDGNSSDKSEDKDIQYEEIRTNSSQPRYQRRAKSQGFTKVKRTSPATAYASIVNINNSTKIHVGSSKTVYHLPSRSDKASEKEDVVETMAIKSLRKNTEPLSRHDISIVSMHMDERWQDVAKALNYSKGQIKQFIIDHKHLGIKEAITQFLIDWTQNDPTEATVANLSNILWDTNQKDVVKRWSEQKQ